jgi:tRNA dimethylallyltransferase
LAAPKVPFLVGPTASGKTSVSIFIARALGAQIISADSRQCYCDLSIGTAKPAPEELAAVPHYFVDCLNPEELFSAGEFGRQARAKIKELLEAGNIPLVVGGSGLYVSALVDDFFEGPSADPDIRDRLKARAATEGVHTLYEELQRIDPQAAGKIMPGDYRRIERALEIFILTGIPISQIRKQQANPPPYTPVMVGLQWPRQQLYERINTRCLQMLEAGLIEETRRLVFDRKLTPELCNALDSVGYKETTQYLRGEVDYNEMVRLFQRNTRHFAKRQISWFSRDPRIEWVEVDENVSVIEIANKVSKIYLSLDIRSGLI